MVAEPSRGRAGVPEREPAPEAVATRLLYERYANRIHGFCLTRLGSREEAEDAVQSTFLNAFRGLQRGIVPESEAAWLFAIAQNVCASRRRSSRRRGRVESTADFDVVQEVAPAPARAAEELIGLEDALSRLPESQRRALLLREWQGLSYREIGAELGLSQSAVETLLFRARRSLADRLEQPERRRVRRGVDLGSLLAGLKSLLLGGGAAAKAAAAVAVVSATAIVATPPLERHLSPHPAPPPSRHAATAPAGPSAGVSAAPAAAPPPAASGLRHQPTRPRAGLRALRPSPGGSPGAATTTPATPPAPAPLTTSAVPPAEPAAPAAAVPAVSAVESPAAAAQTGAGDTGTNVGGQPTERPAAQDHGRGHRPTNPGPPEDRPARNGDGGRRGHESPGSDARNAPTLAAPVQTPPAEGTLTASTDTTPTQAPPAQGVPAQATPSEPTHPQPPQSPPGQAEQSGPPESQSDPPPQSPPDASGGDASHGHGSAGAHGGGGH